MADHQGDLILASCLERLGCSSYLPVFVANEIDFELFKSLSKDELGAILAGKIGPQKKIYSEIERIRAIDVAMAGGGNVKTPPPTAPPSQHQQGATSPQAGGGQPNFRTASTGSNSSATSLNGSVRPRAPGPPNAGPPAATTEQKGLLERYGLGLPSVGAFATAIAVGTVQKHIIDNYTHPFVFGSTPAGATPANGTAPAPTPTDPATGVGPVDTTIGEGVVPAIPGGGTNPGMDEYLAKYGDPKDPTAAGVGSRSMAAEPDPYATEFVDPEAHYYDNGDYGYADAGGYDAGTDIAATDYGVADGFTGAAGDGEDPVVSLISGIVGAFTGGDQI